MPSWIESHTTMRNHKKLIALCNTLQISRASAIGHLHMLWWWAIENRETGDLTGLFDKDIAIACDWDGEPKVLIDALHATEWLKKYHITDWDDYSYRLLVMRQSNRERQRRHRSVTRDVTGYVPPATEQNRTKPKDIQTEFLDELKRNQAYKGLDIDKELLRMDAWLSAHHGRKKTKRFIVNWLNKAEIPLGPSESPANTQKLFPTDKYFNNG